MLALTSRQRSVAVVSPRAAVSVTTGTRGVCKRQFFELIHRMIIDAVELCAQLLRRTSEGIVAVAAKASRWWGTLRLHHEAWGCFFFHEVFLLKSTFRRIHMPYAWSCAPTREGNLFHPNVLYTFAEACATHSERSFIAMLARKSTWGESHDYLFAFIFMCRCEKSALLNVSVRNSVCSLMFFYEAVFSRWIKRKSRECIAIPYLYLAWLNWIFYVVSKPVTNIFLFFYYIQITFVWIISTSSTNPSREIIFHLSLIRQRYSVRTRFSLGRMVIFCFYRWHTHILVPS